VRALVLSHYDPHGLIDDHVMHALRCYRQHFDHVLVVSTADLSVSQQRRTLSLADAVICRNNLGYDFGSWRVGFEQLPVARCQEIVFANDSVYGPCHDMATFLDKAQKLDSDLWGATINRQFRPHVQSFFMGFRAPLLRSGFASRFWRQVEPTPSKMDLIMKYEVGLSVMVEEAGFRIGAVADLGEVSDAARHRALDENRPAEACPAWTDAKNLIQDDTAPNPVQLFWGETLRLGAPFLKVELLRDNPLGANLRAVFQHLRSERWLDTSLILGHLGRVTSPQRFADILAVARPTG
jgi:lipopolysaccharide biosynthesis protein